VPSDAHTIEEALRKADVALYRAKAEKRSTHRFFESGMDTWVHGRAAMELALRQALDAGVIETLYQPIVDLRSQKVVGFEASPRWVDAVQGEVPAERFIAVAEEGGLIHELAEQTLRKACRAVGAWPGHVALDPGQLKDKFLPKRMLQVLSEHGIAPSRLEVDITESALVADMEGAEAVLDSLRSAGVRISLRNFGTGYSSLYHLRNLKLDKIKIDRSFVQAMTSERESAGIVNALVGLGKGLGLVISAEGIDANEQAASLLSTGCAQGQGHFFGSLFTAEQAAGLLGRQVLAQATVSIAA
jgi:predicted signal transduction protein with EAL and GGDEF domain